MARRPAAGWGHPAPGWAQAFPGWDPLPDAGSLPFRAARSLTRWWWPLSAITGFLAVVAYVVAHDPQPGLSNRDWLTVVLAAVVVATLSVRRTRGIGRAPLARALAEYAVVALLAMLLATAGSQQPTPAPEDAAGRQPPTEQSAERRPPAGQPADRASADAGAAVDRRPGIVRVVTGVWGWLAELWRDAGELADGRTTPTSTTTPKPRARALPALALPIWRFHR
jgi:hypothetical protein